MSYGTQKIRKSKKRNKTLKRKKRDKKGGVNGRTMTIQSAPAAQSAPQLLQLALPPGYEAPPQSAPAALEGAQRSFLGTGTAGRRLGSEPADEHDTENRHADM